MALINAALRVAADAYRNHSQPGDPGRGSVRTGSREATRGDVHVGTGDAVRAVVRAEPGEAVRGPVRPGDGDAVGRGVRTEAGEAGRASVRARSGAVAPPAAERPAVRRPLGKPLVPAPGPAPAHPSDRWKTADEWKMRAECGPGDTELFFSKDAVEKRAALAICHDCPVARECLAEAMAQEQGMNLHGRYGIRGGLQPSERLDLARGGTKRPGKPRAGRTKKNPD